jgi:spore coat protein CotH
MPTPGWPPVAPVHRRPWPVGAILVAALLLPSCGGGGSEPDAGPSSTTAAPEGTVELFDPTVVHSIAIEYEDADYDEMIDTYSESGEKDWIEATVTVDGEVYEQAGLRLKGNSSLMGLRGGRGGGGPGGGAGADAPEGLPWLIRFDEFVEGQLHQDHADVVVRSNSSATSLNEALALDLLAAADLASQEAVFTSFSVNGGDEVLRLAIEHPDDDAWQDRSFEAKGALYKAESTGDWSYRGHDEAAYAEVFDQEGGKKVADLTPLMDLLQFVNESDDATFAAELEEHLDVGGFAAYLAMMELVQNFDDIDGPGNNAYLWWDAETERFTVVPWDLNLAFGGGGFGGPGGGPGGGFDPDQLPEGVEPPEGRQPPEGIDPGAIPGGGELPGGGQPPGGGGGPGGRFGRENVLVQRFHEVEAFEATFQERLADLRAELFESDEATSLLDARTEALRGTDLVEASTVSEEAGALRDQLEATAADGD